ncbi:cytochrome P450 [Rhodococcus sp. B50]|uniref:cytochrome P450 n=1 Tax=Rhodococcus sp. B50 TaxID=2682847 RepID=UPI001BD5A61B|nr:cytochrome P450 [Rhodococcus sp. B50]MBS9376004.1 Methyl-branched lipid omega-hydroxylase [Rhodococcus sp. B50]
MTTEAALLRPYDSTNLSARAFWSTTAADREQVYADLRANRPVTWHPPVEDALLKDPDDPGYWAVMRHADIVEVSRRNDVFISGQGTMFENVPEELLEASQSFLAMDPPRHTQLRKLVSAAFTPKQVKRIESQIRANAKAIVSGLAQAGSGADFVTHCARLLPLQTISDMVGIPDDLRGDVSEGAEALVSWADQVYLAGRDPLQMVGQWTQRLHEIALTVAEQRRREPTDDLMTSLVEAEVDGQQLTDAEIAAFFVLLCVAGNDTTRQTTSHALKALTDNPDQRAWLLEDFDGRIGGAIEEFVRWASPVMTFRRTAATDFELNNERITAGDKVVMFYASGNWDTSVFSSPDVLNLSRDPNPHLAFGGGGAHFCLGNQVAKIQLRAIFRELFLQLPDIQAGSPQYVTGNFVHAIREMPCYFGG